MTTVLLILSFLGFLTIVAEDFTKVDKAKTTLFFGTLVWVLYFIAPPDGLEAPQLMHALNENLLEIATLWLFLMAAMTFVAYVSHKGVIDGIVNRVMPTHMSERRLMLVTGLFAFFFSSMADNITATLVCITVLVSLNLSTDKLLRYIVLVVFAVNSGGAALITGDVTTLMIFLAGKVKIADLFLLSLPALFAVLFLSFLLSRSLKGEVVLVKREIEVAMGDRIIAGLFLATIIGTIGASIAFGIPPVLSFLFGLAVMFMAVHFLNKDEPVLEYIRKIEFDTLLFFLGVLLLVGMLKELQVLEHFPTLYEKLPVVVANYAVGLFSAVLDNVPLTAALLKSGIEMTEGQWLTLTYSVGVGGSLLAIGSAAGVVAMSKIPALSFIAYFRYFGYLLLAYTVGFIGVVAVSYFL
ncbi:sodium:proton antiporter NhaD [Denitrificimonas caeni]|uniref:Sodium:proton antiporter NhaD n=1 Tax=Denitrificimonas caeni TaxID=521720 RepID=A0AAE9VSK1_9GAMM|nr:sodium:proton antiporter NhaD [Denitrificimonas caeni]WBE25610.1 sodium:proton antiporter NhaD [Denitrificimonas caeni]